MSTTPSPDEPKQGNWWQRLGKGGKAAVIVGVLIVIGAIASASEEPTTQNGGGEQQASESNGASAGDSAEDSGGGEEDKKCTNRATDDCTPRVGPDETVRVDALTWELTDVTTQETIGEQELGLGEEAQGVYLVADLKVTSNRNESVTLSDDIVTLVVGDRTYSPDNNGTIAAIGAGEEPLFFDDIGPDSTLESTVVFDVPENVLSEDLALRFGELGFGSTEGFIELPNLG